MRATSAIPFRPSRFGRRWGLVLIVLIASAPGCVSAPVRQSVRIDNDVARINPVLVIPRERRTPSTRTLVMSPDGLRLLTDQPLAIWNLSDASRSDLDFPLRGGHVLAWSADGQTIATAFQGSPSGDSPDFLVRIWNARDARPIRAIEINPSFTPKGLAFSPDGSLLAWLGFYRAQWRLTVIDMRSGESATATLPKSDTRWIFSHVYQVPVSISADNQRICFHQCAWAVERSPKLNVKRERSYTMPIMATSPDVRYAHSVADQYVINGRAAAREIGIVLTSGFSDSNADHSREVALYEFDLSSGAVTTRREFSNPHQYRQKPTDPNISMATNSMAASADGKRLALATVQGIHLIDLPNSKDLGHLLYSADNLSNWQTILPMQRFHAIALSHDGSRIVGATQQGVFVWEVP